MRRALMGLNLYGREAARHKLENGQKTQKMQFKFFFSKKKKKLLHPHENKSQIMCYNGWDSIFNNMMVYSQK